MPDSFTGFDPKALTFFRKLAKNNDREWFNAHKQEYEKYLKEPMLLLLEQFNARVARFAADHVTEPKKAIYRIYRDTRFSKNKIPFKLNISAMFGHRLLPKNYCAGFYFHISATECAMGVGLYMSEPDQLTAVRKAIVQKPDAFKKIIDDKKLRSLMGDLHGEKLVRVPKGYDPEDPASEYAKMKQFYFYKELPASLALEKKLLDELSKRFEATVPFANYINAILMKMSRNDSEPDAPKRPAPMF